jgi:predicted GNAT family acetyltransferase
MHGMPDMVVIDSPAHERFEIAVDGELAGFVQYKRRRQLIALIHTEVQARFEGQGVAGTLIRQALDTARDERLIVLPFCPFVHGYIERHLEYVDLVPPGQRADFGLPDAAAT